MIKPAYQKPIDKATLETTLGYFEELLKLLHPFMPFISEEIWSLISERETKEDRLIVTAWPKVNTIDTTILANEKVASEVISGIRTIRNEKNIANKDQVEVFVKLNEDTDKSFDSVITKLGNLSTLHYVDAKVEGALSFRVKSNEYYIPLAGAVNIEEEIATLSQELKYTQGFLNSVMKKLSNERFVNNAPEQVITIERKKQTDAEAKIKTLEEQLAAIQ